MPVAASPAPWNSSVCSPSAPPVIRSADRIPDTHDRGGSLDVVVERRDPIAIFLQQPERIVAREVLELDHDAGEKLAGGDHELLDQGVVFLAAHARLMQADIERIVEQLGVVGADVEKHRQAGARRHARAGGIERQLADRNAHAVGAQVAEAQDALAVADDDDRHVASRPVGEHLRDAAAVGRTDEDAVRTLKDVRVPLAGEPDRRRVDDGHHFIRMIHQQAEEKRLVAVVQRPQIDVLLEIARLAAEILEHALQLLFLRRDVRRQQAAQVQRIALGFGERGSLVERRILQERNAFRQRGRRVRHCIVVTFLQHRSFLSLLARLRCGSSARRVARGFSWSPEPS